ncbi:MAG: hypothetical protein LC648_07610, partial [Novosphingobium sp.]|nr:hypothetical protein [Novosphingobium sp.]
MTAAYPSYADEPPFERPAAFASPPPSAEPDAVEHHEAPVPAEPAAERVAGFDPPPPPERPEGDVGPVADEVPDAPPLYAPPEPELPAIPVEGPNAVDVVFHDSPSSFEYEPPFRP